MTDKKPPAELEKQLKNDNRDVADLWKEALKDYKGIVGFDLQRKFDNVQGMLDFGIDQMNNFHKFRHDGGKVDRLRTLFASNLDLVEQSANQIIAAAAPAFPPAAAIGTAMTFMLQACRAAKADYDMVIVFFDDMNSFLTRITILETRLPKDKAYQNCLMDVFTSFLTMCGIAHKYIELGRFKKWISGLLKGIIGDDDDLGGARAGMDKNLQHLQQATEFAILGNTEETLAMTAQLEENQQSHKEMLQKVGQAIDTIQENTENIKDDVAKLLKLFGGDQGEKKIEKPQANKPPSASALRNGLPTVANDDHEYNVLKETLLPDSCGWVFQEPEWEQWLSVKDGSRPLLAITGPPGAGKSHLAASVHDKLAHMAKDDESGHTCIGHFYFREREFTYQWFVAGIVTVINQLAETNSAACDKFIAQYARDDIYFDLRSWQRLVKIFLGAVFDRNSKFHLFLLLDGLDELCDWQSFTDFLSKFIQEEQYKISLIVTTRPKRLDDLPEDTKLVRIEVTKEKQRQDLKALIWHRINALQHLRRFSRYVQQRIADKVEETAPNMLYAEHVLFRLNNLGREGAVLRALEKDKPKDLHGIYEILLAECQRRMPANHQQTAASLLHWIAFALNSPSLNQVQSLVKFLSQDEMFDIEEIPEFFSRFLRIGYAGLDAELRAKFQNIEDAGVQDLRQDEDGNNDAIYDDGPLPVKFQERSMRDYFTNSSHGSSPLRWGPSEARRRILLTSTKLIQRSQTDDESLQKYCATYYITHWIAIRIDQHTPQEQIEVLEAFAEVLSDRTGFSELLGKTDVSYNRSRIAAADEKAQEWSKLIDRAAIKESLSDFAMGWWRSVGETPSNLRLGLVKGYLCELYGAKTSENANKTWRRLCSLMHVTGLGGLLYDQASVNFPDLFEARKNNNAKDKTAVPAQIIGDAAEKNSSEVQEEAQKKGGEETAEDDFDENFASLGILNLFGDEIKPDAGAHRAVAQALVEADFHEPAEETCKTALELCKPADEEWYRSSCVLSEILLLREKKREAHQVMLEAVAQLSSNNISPYLSRQVYAACARAQKKRHHYDAAIESYGKGKTADPDGVTPAADLIDELEVVEKKQDKIEYIRKLKSWSLLERITWIASNYSEDNEGRLERFCDIATETGEQNFIVNFYQEAIALLDNLEASTPLRIDLAYIQLHVCRDPEKALEVHDQVLDNRSTSFKFPITGADDSDTVYRAIHLMANIQLELFRKSRDPIYKGRCLDSLVDLMQRPFSMSLPQESPFYTSQRRVALSYMYMVMGPLSKFQEAVQSLLNDSFTGLSDSVGWNDHQYLGLLAQTLGLLSLALRKDGKLMRYARIVGSAIFSKLSNISLNSKDDPEEESESDEEVDDAPEEDGDLRRPGTSLYTCEGFCHPKREFYHWGGPGGQSAYFYPVLSSGLICEECQDSYAHEAVRRGERKLQGRHFHGIEHTYFKLPIEGWRGVRDGMLTIEGEEPVSMKMDKFLEKVRTEVCQEAWDRLWAGDL
ncbi:hypothetical protein ACHAPJ_008308 [Fusarium lateritium]